MPELPEVEVTRRQLEPLLVTRRISAVHTTRPSCFFLTRPATLRRCLVGRTTARLERLGKYLIAHLDDGARLLLHLGMTGELVREGGVPVDGHVHLRLEFADGRPGVHFRDERKFGKIQILRAGQVSRRLARLGPDALSVTGERVFRASRGRRVPIKTLLLDQAVLAGVGNIYADEALFLAGIRPTRRAARLTRAECGKLAAEVRRVLRRGIAAGGASISDFVQPEGGAGRYQDERLVYARDHEACRRCRAVIKRVVLGQRSAHYCPSCQS